MSQEYTSICIYGVKLTPELSEKIFLLISEKQFWKEYDDCFVLMNEDNKDGKGNWGTVYPEDMLYDYVDLRNGNEACHSGGPYENIIDFFNAFSFCSRLVEVKDVEPFNINNKPSNRNQRYNADFIHADLTSEKTIHYKNGADHIFGIFIAANNRYLKDDIDFYKSNINEKVYSNFEKYCTPILTAFEIATKPQIYDLLQIW